MGLSLVAAMALVPLVSLVKVDDAVPGTRVDTAARATAAPLDVDRGDPIEVSRSRRIDVEPTADVAPSPAPPPTTAVVAEAPPPTEAPTTTTARPTTTTAKPTTTTAKAPTTTARPTTTTTTPPTTTTAAPVRAEEGKASYYDGATADECAHRTLPFGTVVTVTNLATGASTTCRVGDRGPFVDGRVIDLADEVFAKLAPLAAGVIDVRITW